jgi:hypothetical protein
MAATTSGPFQVCLSTEYNLSRRLYTYDNAEDDPIQPENDLVIDSPYNAPHLSEDTHRAKGIDMHRTRMPAVQPVHKGDTLKGVSMMKYTI